MYLCFMGQTYRKTLPELPLSSPHGKSHETCWSYAQVPSKGMWTHRNHRSGLWKSHPGNRKGSRSSLTHLTLLDSRESIQFSCDASGSLNQSNATKALGKKFRNT